MRPFDTILIADWSSSATPSPARPTADAIWIGEWGPDEGASSRYYRTRDAAEAAIFDSLNAALSEGRRVLLGFDFAFGYPVGFAARLAGHAHAFAVWDWLRKELRDGPDNDNDRFDVADKINARFPGVGPFWGHPQGRHHPNLPPRDVRDGHGMAKHRLTETRAEGRPQSPFKLAGAGAVGGQTLVGLPMLARLRHHYEGRLGVWPFEDHALDREIVLAEVYPSLLPIHTAEGEIRDDLQVRNLAAALGRMQTEGTLASAFAAAQGPVPHEEGWILGVGCETALRRAAMPDLRPPRLRDDCFALPAGVDWVPVDEALDRLRAGLSAVTGSETAPVAEAAGRVLAAEAVARRSNPPAPNSAVDGYGFDHSAAGAGVTILPLAPGRAAAGVPFEGALTAGHALRILTGAILPEGVDTVLLEEDCTVAHGHVAFAGPVKPRANTRRAGEDVTTGEVALPAGHVLRAPDLALLSAVGLAEVAVRARLRVGVLSTGDEVRPPGTAGPAREINDANRPMLLALARGWGHRAVDLGIAPDDRDALRTALDSAARDCDAILTSGGASAGDEDHVSALLRAEGRVEAWRIALKPGRPLMLGLWRGVPVFGMPGNPVAALVCALIFARPALSVMAGGAWTELQGFTVPAAFTKSKKPGRREFLRARLDAEGRAEVFPSEGSGRISGLAWATGLVEIGDAAQEIAPGDPVRFLPYSAFGIA